MTSDKGTFNLTAPPGASELEVSAIGYLKKTVAISSEMLNIQLDTANVKLEKIVVIGYGTQKKPLVSGAVATVKGSELAKSSSVNLSNSLVGRMPGVTVLQGSGEPGNDGSTIRIRGINSLPGGNSAPLIIIDGVPERAGGLSRLNPNDIESISVLKDASAAIYGSRSGNGVIFITTKQGKTGKPRFSYEFVYGGQRPTHIPKMANSSEYTSIINEVTGVYPQNPARWAEIWNAFNIGTGVYTDGTVSVTPKYPPEERQKYTDASDLLRYPNTDWFANHQQKMGTAAKT